jgi:TonB-dependent starch-binding outer membrane protein SusC
MQINSSKVLSLGGNNVGKIGHYPDYVDAGTPLVVFKEGNAPGAFWGYINEGVVQENNDGNNISSPIAGDYKFADLDGNGIINENDKAVIGNATPDFTYSLNGGIVYGNFDFTFVLNGAAGGDIFNIEKAITESSGGYNNRSIEMKNRWTELNPSQEQARVIMTDPNNNNRLSSVMIESGSFFRFKRIELGYDFNFIGKNRNRAYISAYDFITFSTYSSGSPYFSGINNNNAIGFGISPFSSTIMIGLQIGI